MKRLLKKTKGVVKGAPSGVVVSLLIHAAAFLLAGLFVVFEVFEKPEPSFVPPQAVERPKMKLKKPKVRVKKSAKPKPTTRIVTKVQKASMPDIQLPEMSGMTDGLAAGIGGFDIMPDLSEVTVFGGGQSIGNEFEGVVYSLLHDRQGGIAPMDEDAFRDVLRKYVLSGWKESKLARYYRSPKKLYSTHVMVPVIPTAMAPGIFGVPELEDYYLFVKYEGKLVHKTDIKFRFWGMGDAYIFVNVDGKEVLMSAWDFHHPWFDWWSSSAAGDRTYVLGNQRMVIGDWIELKAGEPLDMKVLFGEWQGGQVAGMLLVEVEGEEYPTSRTGGPLLPAFKTEEFSWDTLTQISRFLPEDECSLTNGPVFSDFYSKPKPTETIAESKPSTLEEVVAVPPETTLRKWTLTNGRTREAEFLTVAGGNAVLKNTRGKQMKIPLDNLSEADRSYISLAVPPDLDINFSKTTKPRKFGDTNSGDEPPVKGSFYTFSTQIRKTSTQPYDHGLTAEYFAVGNEVGGDKNILLEYQRTDFALTEENNNAFEFGGRPVELLNYEYNGQRRGQRYGGFLVVVTDSRGKVIAHESPSKNLYRNLENLRKLRVGWYFDDNDCSRCLPTPPQPVATPSLNN